MKKEILEVVEIPHGIEIEIDGNMLILKKNEKELKRKLVGFDIEKEGNKISLHCKKAGKKEKSLIMTGVAHIKNMIRGLEKNFEYKLEICAVHFPMSAGYDKNKNEFSIKNFLGETMPRTGKLPENVEVKIDGKIISISSFDKEAAGLAASVIERISKVRKKDRRIFQDGIFLIEKPGREL